MTSDPQGLYLYHNLLTVSTLQRPYYCYCYTFILYTTPGLQSLSRISEPAHGASTREIILRNIKLVSDLSFIGKTEYVLCHT
jgi:hypothetical protein